MFDLALSEHNDLVIAGNRDLAGVSGTDLIEQRIRLRLKIRRGTWVYDEGKTLGSQLFQLIGTSPDEVHTSVGAYVREALRPMSNEIEIQDVIHQHDMTTPDLALSNREIEIMVLYTVIGDLDPGTEGVSEQRTVSVNIPVGGGGV